MDVSIKIKERLRSLLSEGKRHSNDIIFPKSQIWFRGESIYSWDFNYFKDIGPLVNVSEEHKTELVVLSDFDAIHSGSLACENLYLVKIINGSVIIGKEIKGILSYTEYHDKRSEKKISEN